MRQGLADRINDCFRRSMNRKPIDVDGAGKPLASGGYAFPPLWGPQSFNDGAAMSHAATAAAFIQAKMPLGRGGTLSDQDAWDIAAFVTGAPRPAYGNRDGDYPGGARPVTR